MSVRRRQRRDPYTKDAPDALEILARLLVGGSYRVPVEGTNTRPGLQASEIAAAVGYMVNPLKAELAMVVAMRGNKQRIAVLSGKAYKRCSYAVRMMNPPRALDLSKGADRWRLRMLVYDVATELVWPERRRPLGELAKDTKMRKATYARAHKVVMAELQQVLNEARIDFRTRLFANDMKE